MQFATRISIQVKRRVKQRGARWETILICGGKRSTWRGIGKVIPTL